MSENSNEIKHHGIPGQKWGVRRYQNKDGSLTPAGRKRADKLKSQYTELTGKRMKRNPAVKKLGKKVDKKDVEADKKKSIKDMTNEELASKTNRMNLEKNYMEAQRNLAKVTPKQVSKGKAFVDKVKKDVVIPAVTDVGKQLFKSYLVKFTNEKLELDKEYKIYTNNKKKD